MSYLKEWPDSLLIVLADSIIPSRLTAGPIAEESEELLKIRIELCLRRFKLTRRELPAASAEAAS